MTRPSLSLRTIKWAFLFVGWIALWSVQDSSDGRVPSSEICFANRSCERVIRVPEETNVPQRHDLSDPLRDTVQTR